ncbi:MAG: 3-phosphoserine/phosphohydroxythreonine transaminase [Oscillospiraceae bacterium]|nr:3-phosphoserine/phosphohydroxythreonine transaminase [Oscillospiraceae bacterium]
MANDRVFNFSAGPAMLPLEVLQRAGSEITNYNGSGMSVMEMSHRSKTYLKIFEDVMARFRKIGNIPDNYKVLFLQGGATTQFAAVPMNLIAPAGKADYIITGQFSKKAADEAKKYGEISIAYDTADRQHTYIPKQSDLVLDPGAAYVHYCCNNTVYGTEWNYVPDVGGKTLVCDMSSNMYSRPFDVSKYGVIYAGAQKNMAPAGLTIVIVREDLAGNALPFTPVMLDYAAQIKGDSMHNTPPCYNIYILGLVLEWIESLGGLEAIAQRNAKKAAVIYDAIDSSRLFRALAEPEARSRMNVTFRTESDEMDKAFIAFAGEAGLQNVKGYRTVGGMRASIYNAMPMEGAEKLADAIRAFDKNN